MQKTPTLDLVYFNAGGGHRSAAMALQTVICSLNLPWQVRLVNLQEILAPLDIFRKITGISAEDVYNLVLAKGWTLGSVYLLPLVHGLVRAYHPAQVKLLKAFWKDAKPDLVVSVVPNFNRALFDSLGESCPGVPLVTILTDLADYPPHFWIEKQRQYLICGTARAVEQARTMGYSKSQIFQTSGMILRPQFYEPQVKDRRAERERLGLNRDLPTGMVMFGGEGSNVMSPIAERLGNSALDLQLIMICGNNKEILRRLKRLKTRNAIFLEGFTKEIPYFMHLSDFFIGKPGPGSISEAIQMKLPVVVERNAWTLPQERFNADWVKEHGVGLVLENFRGIEAAVTKILTGGVLPAMQTRIEALDNRAVFEIPPILAKILEEHAAGMGARAS